MIICPRCSHIFPQPTGTDNRSSDFGEPNPYPHNRIDRFLDRLSRRILSGTLVCSIASLAQLIGRIMDTPGLGLASRTLSTIGVGLIVGAFLVTLCKRPGGPKRGPDNI